MIYIWFDRRLSKPSMKSTNPKTPTQFNSKKVSLPFELLLRAGRFTRYLRHWTGYNTLDRFYKKHLPENCHIRISDFDDGIIVDVNPRHPIGISLLNYPDLLEKEAREAFLETINSESTVLDIGANIGLYTLLAAKRGARVFAIEADPINAISLRHHIEINNFMDRVTVFEMAATDSATTVVISRDKLNPGQTNILSRGIPGETVIGRTIDSLNLPPIDVCKMDIEGAELMALNGMQETLARSPNMRLIMEFAEVLGSGQALIRFLRSHFHQLIVLEHPDADIDSALPPYCNILATRA